MAQHPQQNGAASSTVAAGTNPDLDADSIARAEQAELEAAVAALEGHMPLDALPLTALPGDATNQVGVDTYNLTTGGMAAPQQTSSSLPASSSSAIDPLNLPDELMLPNNSTDDNLSSSSLLSTDLTSTGFDMNGASSLTHSSMPMPLPMPLPFPMPLAQPASSSSFNAAPSTAGLLPIPMAPVPKPRPSFSVPPPAPSPTSVQSDDGAVDGTGGVAASALPSSASASASASPTSIPSSPVVLPPRPIRVRELCIHAPYICPFPTCDTAYQAFLGLNNHVHGEHGRAFGKRRMDGEHEQIPCVHCHRRFKTFKGWRSHVQQHAQDEEAWIKKRNEARSTRKEAIRARRAAAIKAAQALPQDHPTTDAAIAAAESMLTELTPNDEAQVDRSCGNNPRGWVCCLCDTIAGSTSWENKLLLPDLSAFIGHLRDRHSYDPSTPTFHCRFFTYQAGTKTKNRCTDVFLSNSERREHEKIMHGLEIREPEHEDASNRMTPASKGPITLLSTKEEDEQVQALLWKQEESGERFRAPHLPPAYTRLLFVLSGRSRMRPYECQVCQANFRDHQALRKHVTSVHPGASVPPQPGSRVEVRRYPCRHAGCEKVFTKTRTRNDHERKDHSHIKRRRQQQQQQQEEMPTMNQTADGHDDDDESDVSEESSNVSIDAQSSTEPLVPSSSILSLPTSHKRKEHPPIIIEGDEVKESMEKKVRA